MKATLNAICVFGLALASVSYGQPAISTGTDLGVYPIGPVQIELTATGGVAPYTWKLISGQLPKGLVLDERGAIAGFASAATPRAEQFTLSSTGQDGENCWKNFHLSIEGSALRSAVAVTTLQLATSAITVGPKAGSQSVMLKAPAAWTAVSNDSWLHVASDSAIGAGYATFHFAFDANPNGSPRGGSFFIGGQSLTVSQAASGALPANVIRTLTRRSLIRERSPRTRRGMCTSLIAPIKRFKSGTRRLETLPP